MYMHAICKIKEFLSYRGFNLIKVYFSVHYSACICYHLFQCRETLPVAPAVNTASAVIMWANMLQSFSTRERNSRLCVKWSPTGG